jgi:hypothetical protein
VEFATPPVFYVLEESGDESKVMGADFNTYTKLRGLETRNRKDGGYDYHCGDVA